MKGVSFVGEIGVGAERRAPSRLGVASRMDLSCGRFRAVVWYLRSVILYGVGYQLPDMGTGCIYRNLY